MVPETPTTTESTGPRSLVPGATERAIALPAEPGTDLRLDDQLCFALYAATGTVVHAYPPLLAELGLASTQHIVMMALQEEDGLTVGSIAARLAIRAASTTPILDRLESIGLLERRRGRPDRRTIHLELAPTGRHLEQPAAHDQHQVRCQTLLDDSALADLRARLHHLTRTLTSPART